MQTAATTRSFEYKGYTIEIAIGDCVKVDSFAYKVLHCLSKHPNNPALDTYECEILYPLLKELKGSILSNPEYRRAISAEYLAEGYLSLERFQQKAVCA